MRCIVTGGAGFIGSRLASRLVADGHDVLIVDRHKGRLPTVVADLSVLEEVRSAFDVFKPEVVYHLGGVADAREVRRKPVAGIKANVLGTCSVLEAAREAQVGHVVIASSVFVYQATRAGQVRENEVFLPEGGGHVHVSGFISREFLAHDYFRSYGLPSTVLRLAPVYGPGMWRGLAVRAFIDAARAGGPIVVFGDGSDRRSFLYVDDLAEAFVKTLCLPREMKVYNIQGPREVTVNELAELVSAQFGGVPIVHRPEPPRAGELDCSQRHIGSGSAELELGWRPRVDIVEGIQLTMADDVPNALSAS